MRPISLLAILLCAWAQGSAQSPAGATLTGRAIDAAASSALPDPTLVRGSLRVDRGEDALPLWIPPAEELEYDVRIELGFLGRVRVGGVTLSTGIEEHRSGLPLPGQAPSPGGQMAGWLRSYAKGGHLGYELRHELRTRVLPQDFPRFVLSDVQEGSEHRKRELRLGVREGAGLASYRHDSHCSGCDRREHFVGSALPFGSPSHCKKCKRGEHRVWREYEERAIPAEAVDLLAAVYLARSFLRERLESTTIPIVDKKRVWNLGISRGRSGRVKSDAGEFECTEILLQSTRPESEPDDGERFAGLFGIRGDLHIWMESATGVPVMIAGDLPVGGIMELGVDVRLSSFQGTPPAFQPLQQR